MRWRRTRGVLLSAVVLCTPPLLALTADVAAQPNLEELVRQSNIIVEATVARMSATNVAAVPPSDHTVVVRVSRVYQAPPSFPRLAGAEITVLVKDPGELRAGDRMVLFSRSWLAGENIAVHEVGRLGDRGGPDLARRIAAARQSGADQSLRERLAGADVVVVGKVTAVRAAPRDPATGVSEHDPFWQEAVVQVSAVLKGDSSLREVVALFPASRDIAWVNTPRFTVGQEGVFILKRDAEAKGLTALDPLDFQPSREGARVRRLLRGGP